MKYLLARLPKTSINMELLAPVELGYASSSLSSACVVDARAERLSITKFLGRIEKINPDFIVCPKAELPLFRQLVRKKVVPAESLMELKQPRWELFPLGKYRPMFTPRAGFLELPVLACGRKAKAVAEEVAAGMERFGAKRMIFMDNDFAGLPGIERLCRALPDTEWICTCRPSSVSRRLLRLFAEKGCSHVIYPVSGIEGLEDAFYWAKEAGLKVDINLLLAGKRAREKVKFVAGLEPDYISFPLVGGNMRALQLGSYLKFYMRPGQLGKVMRILDLGPFIKFEKKIKAGEQHF